MIKTINGKTINIPASVIQKFMVNLGISEEEAVNLYLDDMGITTNIEQKTLIEKAEKTVKTANLVKARASVEKTQSERVKKPDETKETIIKEIASALEKLGIVTIIDPRKIITLTIRDEKFKLDLTRTRQPKK